MTRTNKKNVRSVLQRKSKDLFYANMHSIIPAFLITSKPEIKKKKHHKIVKPRTNYKHLIYHEETPQREIQQDQVKPDKHDLKKTPNIFQDNHKSDQLHQAITNSVCKKTVRKEIKPKPKKVQLSQTKQGSNFSNQLSISLLNSIEDYFS